MPVPFRDMGVIPESNGSHRKICDIPGCNQSYAISKVGDGRIEHFKKRHTNPATGLCQCPFCNVLPMSAEALIRHLRQKACIRPQDRQVRCPVCGTEGSQQNLKRHMGSKKCRALSGHPEMDDATGEGKEEEEQKGPIPGPSNSKRNRDDWGDQDPPSLAQFSSDLSF